MTRTVVALSFLVSLLIAAPAYAEDEYSPFDFCRDFSLIANQVMTARQRNRPMSEALSEATEKIKGWRDKYGLEMDTKDLEEAAAQTVIAAYAERIRATERYQQIAITEFENEIFKDCYEELISDSEE